MVRSHAVAVLLAAAFLAHGCESVTTLEDLAHDPAVHVESAIARDQCRCQCDALVCWSFSCSNTGCSRADEYELTVVYGPGADNGECLDKPPTLTATLVAADAAPRAPRYVSEGCGEASFTWRMPAGQFDPTSSHRVEVADETATWTIEGAFSPHAPTIIAPATAASPEAGAARVILAGAQLVIGVLPPVGIVTPRATIKAVVSDPFQPPSNLPIVAVEDDRVTLAVPAATAIGRHDIAVGLGVVLGPDACQGPPACHGPSAAAHWEVRVE